MKLVSRIAADAALYWLLGIALYAEIGNAWVFVPVGLALGEAVTARLWQASNETTVRLAREAMDLAKTNERQTAAALDLVSRSISVTNSAMEQAWRPRSQ